MKKITLFLFSLTLVCALHCQDQNKEGEAFYMLDANFKGTTQEKAAYFIHAEKIHDSCWQFDTYNINGPLISSEQYNDERGTVANGEFLYYNKKGTLDSIGNFSDGSQDGTWYFLNESGKYILKKDYKLGVLIAFKDLTKKDPEDIIQAKDVKKIVTEEKESEFPGKVAGWTNYLSSNMVYPQRAQNLVIQGTVIVQFIVDTAGHIATAQIAQSIEYSLDGEALRLIKQSPAWIAATQDGKKVKSYKKQPVTFRLQ